MLQHKNDLDIALSNIYTSNLIYGHQLKRFVITVQSSDFLFSFIVFNLRIPKNLLVKVWSLRWQN